MNEIVVKLDSVKKYRNSSEYHTLQRATCDYEGKTYEKVGNGAIIKSLLRDLSNEKGQISGQVAVMRGNTLCFTVCSVESWINPPKKFANKGLEEYWKSRNTTKL